MNNKSKTVKICLTALFSALICVATMVIRIPSPFGYINFGDCILLVGAWVLSPAYAFVAGATGSALADLFSGYAVYAPATFLIKGIMSVAASLLAKRLSHKFARVVSGGLAELIMISGYYLFEAFIIGYGAEASLVNIPYNAIQGLLGIIGGTLIFAAVNKILKRHDI